MPSDGNTRPAVFFDRDNTLMVSDGYLGDPSRVALVADAAGAVARARRLGFATVVVSNQSGVARGLFDPEAVEAVNAELERQLRHQHPEALIDHQEYCPYHPDAAVERYRRESELRKPRPGMLLAAAEKLSLDLHRSWMVGDAPRDVEAGHAAGCRTILVVNPHLAASPAAEAPAAVEPDFVVRNLEEAMDLIERESTLSAGPNPAPGELPERPAESTSPAGAPGDAPSQSSRLEHLTEQILIELRRQREREEGEFSVSRLLAGIVQIGVLAALLFAYFHHRTPETLHSLLLLAVTLQALVIALLIMGRQR